MVRTAATTAVVVGTAGAVRHHQDQKYANQQAQQQAQYEQQPQEQQYIEAEPQQVVVQQAAPADLATQLQSLADLHASGVLSDEEYAAAKAKLISG
jgi:hypothetical protein